MHIRFSFCLIIYSFVCQYSLHYNLTAIIRSSRPLLLCKKDVLENFAKFTRKHQKRYFLVNSAKILIIPFLKNSSDDCFCIITRSIYCTTTTFGLFKNNITHIFWLSVFSAWFVGWEQKWAQCFKPLARSLFTTQSNICDGVFLAKIVNSWKPLIIFVEIAPL